MDKNTSFLVMLRQTLEAQKEGLTTIKTYETICDFLSYNNRLVDLKDPIAKLKTESERTIPIYNKAIDKIKDVIDIMQKYPHNQDIIVKEFECLIPTVKSMGDRMKYLSGIAEPIISQLESHKTFLDDLLTFEKNKGCAPTYSN